MALDKFKATWVSHSSINDFLVCPRLYYLRNVYKDPTSGRKITVMSPPLALGGVVHDVIESLSTLPVEERLKISLLKKFSSAWQQVSGKKGGFKSKEEETLYRERGERMLQRVMGNPGPVSKRAVKIKDELPQYWLSEEDEIILCGKIDWLEYVEESDSVHIIDFKTGRREEDSGSLQLPIYLLLVTNTQKRQVKRASYWYLESSDEPAEQKLPELAEARGRVLEVAKKIKLARQIEHFECPSGGCGWCTPLEEVLAGRGEYIGTSSYNQDIYILPASRQRGERL